MPIDTGLLWHQHRLRRLISSKTRPKQGSTCLHICIVYRIYMESVLIAVTVKKRISLYFGRTLFWVFSFVHKIVLFGAFPRAKNRAVDRAFWCSPSCTKSCSRSCFLVPSFVPQIVFFSFVHWSKHRALDRVSWCSPWCHKSFFFVRSFVPKIVL